MGIGKTMTSQGSQRRGEVRPLGVLRPLGQKGNRTQNRLERKIKNSLYSTELGICLLNTVDWELFIYKYIKHFPSFPHIREVNHLLMSIFLCACHSMNRWF